MTFYGVKVPVAVPLHVECRFWPEDGGWKAVCDDPALTVRGASFPEAKKNMGAALAQAIALRLTNRPA